MDAQTEHTEAHVERVAFQTEVQKLLDLIIHSLYSNKDIFLRSTNFVSRASRAKSSYRRRSCMYFSSPTQRHVRFRFPTTASG